MAWRYNEYQGPHGLTLPVQGTYINDPRTNETPLWGGHFTEVPDHVYNKLTSEDYVYFNIPCGMPVKAYSVAIESNDVTDGHQFKIIGYLSQAVRVPAVRFSPRARIALVPSSSNLPRYVGQFGRGALYLPTWTSGPKPPVIVMDKQGMV